MLTKKKKNPSVPIMRNLLPGAFHGNANDLQSDIDYYCCTWMHLRG